MASKTEGKDFTSSCDRRKEESKSKIKFKGNRDAKRRFDINSLIRVDNNRSPIDTYHKQDFKTSDSAQNHSRLDGHYNIRPTTSSKCHYEELSYPVTRTSPLSEQNYFTTSANISKYNVLQVVQPTSSGAGCSDCSATQQLDPKHEETVIGVQSEDCSRSKKIQDIHEGGAQFIPSLDPQIEVPFQPQLNTSSLETTAELTALMPSLTALATYSMFNWCAKCNASFRMTSDLVHHMRTHHKKRKYSEDM